MHCDVKSPGGGDGLLWHCVVMFRIYNQYYTHNHIHIPHHYIRYESKLVKQSISDLLTSNLKVISTLVTIY